MKTATESEWRAFDEFWHDTLIPAWLDGGGRLEDVLVTKDTAWESWLEGNFDHEGLRP